MPEVKAGPPPRAFTRRTIAPRGPERGMGAPRVAPQVERRVPLAPSADPITRAEAELMAQVESPQYTKGMAGEIMAMVGRSSAMQLARAEYAGMSADINNTRGLRRITKINATKELRELEKRIQHKARLNEKDAAATREAATTPHDKALAYDFQIEMKAQSLAHYTEAVAELKKNTAAEMGKTGIGGAVVDSARENNIRRYEKQIQLLEDDLTRSRAEREQIVDSNGVVIGNQVAVMAENFASKVHPDLTEDQRQAIRENPSRAMVEMTANALASGKPEQYKAILSSLKESGMSPETIRDFENAVQIYQERSPAERTFNVARTSLLMFLLLAAAGMYMGKKKADGAEVQGH